MSHSEHDPFSGFSKRSHNERFDLLKRLSILSDEDCLYLQTGGLTDFTLAENFIENVIGYFQLPMGVAPHFVIDGIERLIPMAVEETSIIAALSKTAKWIKNCGSIKTTMKGTTSIGQLQIAPVKDFLNLQNIITKHKESLIDLANMNVASGLVKRGGGVKDISLRSLDDMAVIHIYVDCCDAMGANIINQVLEYLKSPIEQLSNESINMCILSNLNDSKLTQATITLNNVDKELGEKIETASRFAECDPYRAATHNKGVMNGIDPVLIVTGNDWRAVEAGIHAYASRDGQYRAITKWRYHDGQLVGQFEAPIAVGTVGGVTKLHPTAKICLKILNVERATELSRICAAVGLVQNLGALRALTTDGIIKGHMKLHIDNLVLASGAKEHETVPLKQSLERLLSSQRHISLSNAHYLLNDIRKNNLELPQV